MQQTRTLIFAVFASIGVIATGPHATSAQDASAPGGYQFFVTPYLWLASVHATTTTPLALRPEVNSNVSTIDLLSHLDGAPFMGSFEARYGNLGFLADAIHLPVSTKITTRDVFYQGGNAELAKPAGLHLNPTFATRGIEAAKLEVFRGVRSKGRHHTGRCHGAATST